MAAGYKVWNSVPYLAENPHIASGIIAGGVVLVGCAVYRATAPKINSATLSSAEDEVFVPSEKFNIRNAFELSVSAIQGVCQDIIGSHYPMFLPMMSFFFIWILLNNVMGSVAGLGSSTDNLNMTLAMGVISFLYYNIQGFRANGIRYLEHYSGHLKGVLLFTMGIFLMFPIELISNAARAVTLGFRLRTNIFADHTVYSIVTGLVNQLGEAMGAGEGFTAMIGTGFGAILSSLLPIPIVLLGILVCIIQAFVFTLLSAVYVGIATSHDDH